MAGEGEFDYFWIALLISFAGWFLGVKSKKQFTFQGKKCLIIAYIGIIISALALSAHVTVGFIFFLYIFLIGGQ